MDKDPDAKTWMRVTLSLDRRVVKKLARQAKSASKHKSRYVADLICADSPVKASA